MKGGDGSRAWFTKEDLRLTPTEKIWWDAAQPGDFRLIKGAATSAADAIRAMALKKRGR
jgi:hypothetical protein